jgi:cytidylate kinase
MRNFIVIWDNAGLESCVDITDLLKSANNFEKEKIFDIIKDPTNVPHNESLQTIGRMTQNMMMRAQVNGQRHYEIYKLDTVDSITQDDLVGMFESDPQISADLVRSHGVKLFSNRKTQKDVIL